MKHKKIGPYFSCHSDKQEKRRKSYEGGTCLRIRHFSV